VHFSVFGKKGVRYDAEGNEIEDQEQQSELSEK
jgi:hypothetical protein